MKRSNDEYVIVKADALWAKAMFRLALQCQKNWLKAQPLKRENEILRGQVAELKSTVEDLIIMAHEQTLQCHNGPTLSD